MRSLLLLTSLSFFIVQADESSKQIIAEDSSVHASIDKLASDDFDCREQAQRDVEAVGQKVIPILKHTLSTSSDPEVRLRCKRAIANVEFDMLLAEVVKTSDLQPLVTWASKAKRTGNFRDVELFYDRAASRLTAQSSSISEQIVSLLQSWTVEARQQAQVEAQAVVDLEVVPVDWAPQE